MKRSIFAVVFAGALIVIADVALNILPISVLPCVIRNIDGMSSPSLCSLTELYGPNKTVSATLTPVGYLVEAILMFFLPVAMGVLLSIQLISPRKPRSSMP